ncbi:polyphosphate kinase 1 [Tenacibaculum jejuense]|uniref:Polyphosphate kinase n=1 Tax=Tenacibaculum jejuense TaxID=584609 RepID=A0A238U700_9FLAO|nr:polyphosphate kinase 1 [Tenacibaculum jejuense]SNR14979.1 Polyphosphate kinase [Tenacibaculum jejuense]
MSLITKQYYNRDLSWLRFNHRVLQEAQDTRNPLYERIKFLAIYSSNLDEFFKVRVSHIRQIKKLDKSLRKKLISKPNKLLKQIKKEVDKQQNKFGKIFRNQILPELKNHQIHLIDEKNLTSSQEKFCVNFYRKLLENKQVEIKEEVFVENEKLYLFAVKEEKELWVKIDGVSRFVVLPKEEDNQHYIMFVDDIIRWNLQKQFEVNFYEVKVSRDAELYIDNEVSGNLLEKIQQSLSNRDVGQVTRILVDEVIPETYLEQLKKSLDVNETDIVVGGKYHNFKDFFSFPNPTDQDLSFVDLPPIQIKEFDHYNSMFEAVLEKDRLFSYPYESFDSFLRFVNEAASDLTVTEIKMTLYRMSSDSKVAQALIKAVENGIKVTIFIETKARFDEENNIKWGKILEAKGVKVHYSYPEIKVHSKILYVKRIIEGEEQNFAYIGTGNFNEKTAEIYTDFGLLTSKKKITTDVAHVFLVLEGNLIIPKTEKILVSPYTTRSGFTELIQNEIEAVESGDEASIILKLNSLQDEKLITQLYKASNKGVQIKIICRGICCLVPGIKLQSENIEVISIVDRFLEHARVFIFSNKGKEKTYIGSADYMTRNLDHRIEVITPITDKEIQSKIKQIMNLQLNDVAKARVIDENQENNYVQKNENYLESAQHKIYEYLKSYH